VNCPLCNNETKNVLTRELRRGERRIVYYCQDCDLGFLDDYKTEKELRDYYQRAYREKHRPDLRAAANPEDLFNSYVNFQQDRVRLIEPYLDKQKRLLEMGCSAGMFLHHIRDRVKQAVGIDFDQNSAEYASKKCDCEVYTTQLVDTPLKNRSFEIICAFQILEHVKSPYEFLSQIKNYLTDNGILYLEVPNLYDVLISSYKLPKHQKFYYHSAHLYYFSQRSLSLLLGKLGFSGQFYFTQDYNIVNHFNWILNDSPQDSCRPGLSIPQFPFRENVSMEVQNQLNSFLRNFDDEYKALLSNLKLTSNIAFIGHKKKK
jgi:2-polyprenyl-3-methyl-5-hydroxy-6-metoxy-1,4-benzoquinol methylase